MTKNFDVRASACERTTGAHSGIPTTSEPRIMPQANIKSPSLLRLAIMLHFALQLILQTCHISQDMIAKQGIYDLYLGVIFSGFRL
jgi:hypothetical protein